MKKISIFVLALMLAFATAACGSNDTAGNTDTAGSTDQTQSSDAAAEEITVTIDIDYPDSSKVTDVENARVVIADGSSVLDVLNKYAEEANIKITMDEGSQMPYVTAINGVEATDTAGWVYEINDEMIMETADKHIVKNGDDIEWSFESWNDTDD